MENRGLAIGLITVTLFAVIFQAIGFFAPAWLIYDMGMNSGDQQPTTSPPPSTRSSKSGFPSFDNNGADSGWGSNTGLSPNNDMSNSFSDMGNSLGSMTGDESIHVEVKLGLWFVYACVDMMGQTMCKSATMDEIQRQINMPNAPGQTDLTKTAANGFFGDFTKQQALATFGMICCIIGMIMVFIFSCNRAEKATQCKGLILCSTMGLSAVLVMAAVGLQSKQYSDAQHAMDLLRAMPELNQIKMDFSFPWALVMSGLGASLSAIVAVWVGLLMCFWNREGIPVSWNRFSNAAV